MVRCRAAFRTNHPTFVENKVVVFFEDLFIEYLTGQAPFHLLDVPMTGQRDTVFVSPGGQRATSCEKRGRQCNGQTAADARCSLVDRLGITHPAEDLRRCSFLGATGASLTERQNQVAPLGAAILGRSRIAHDIGRRSSRSAWRPRRRKPILTAGSHWPPRRCHAGSAPPARQYHRKKPLRRRRKASNRRRLDALFAALCPSPKIAMHASHPP